MSDEPSNEPETVPTLDDVISEYNVQSDPATMERAPIEPQIPQQQFSPVDPLDADQWNSYQQQQSQQTIALQGQLQDVSAQLDQFRQERVQNQTEADIQSAVKAVSGQVEDSDPLMVELFLEKRARENDGFRKIWDNRATNPKALNAALGAISNELKGKFSVKADPQLAENQRAIQQSQQSNTATNQTSYSNSIEESLGNAQSDAEWDRAWNDAIRGG